MKKTLTTFVLASTLLAGKASAEIQLTGFANIVGGITTSSNEALYGFDDAFNFNQGSLFALQATSDLSDKLGATVQVLAKGQNDWDPEFSWAYLSYDATDNLRILAGRQRLPFFMYSDYLDVSYAFPWITAPTEVYTAPFNDFDGLAVIYNKSLGDFDATFHGFYGSAESNANDIIGLTTSVNNDWLTLRASYIVVNDFTAPIPSFDGLSAGWRQAGYNELADVSQIADDEVSFVGLGFKMAFDKLTIIGEYVNIELGETLFGDREPLYITAGYQIADKVLLHLTYSHDESTPSYNTSAAADDTSIVVAGVPGDFTQPGLKATTDFTLALFTAETSSITVGARYDFHDSAALKFEYKDYTDDLNSANDAGLFRVALVTVF